MRLQVRDLQRSYVELAAADTSVGRIKDAYEHELGSEQSPERAVGIGRVLEACDQAETALFNVLNTASSFCGDSLAFAEIRKRLPEL